jgi:hypothetical protein
MQISLCPVRCDETLSVIKTGEVLVINGDRIDLSVLPEGASLPAFAIGNSWMVGNVQRVDGALHLTLLLPHGSNPSEATAFPAPLDNPPDGELKLPQDMMEA